MRQLIRRFRTCEAGAGAVEYALLIAVVALGLVGMLTIFRNSVGDLTNRTAVSVSKKSSGGYGKGGGIGGGSRGGPVAYKPAADEPDSSSAQPDSSSATAGATAARFDPTKP